MKRWLLVALFTLLPVALAAATNPPSATLSPTNPSVTFTGGPFSVSNPSNPIGEHPPVCTDSTCGQFALTVSIPATDFNTYKAEVTVGWTNSGTTTQGSATSDYDVFIYSPDETGSQIGSAASTNNPEQTSFDAASGSYTIYVVPYDVSPSVPFTATVTLVRNNAVGNSWPPNLGNTTVPPGTPRFLNYPAPDGVADAAGEPSVGVNRKT